MARNDRDWDPTDDWESREGGHAQRDRTQDTQPIDFSDWWEGSAQSVEEDDFDPFDFDPFDFDPLDREDLRPSPRPKKKKKGCLGKLLGLFLLAAIALVAFAGFFFVRDLSQWDQEKTALPVPAASEGNQLAPVQEDLLFLMAGVDDTDGGVVQRTDTLMLVRMNFQKQEVTLLSIPRDTRCYVDGELTKINHAYAYGGIELTMETVRNFLGLDLDYYLIVDFDMVKDLVDAGGGVRYHVPEDAEPVNGEPYQTGDHVLNGEETLAYLRHRYGYALGDLGRVQAQQSFLAEIVKQLASPSKAAHFPQMYKILRSEAKTNIPALPLLPKALDLLKMKDHLQSYTLPGEGEYIDDISYFIVDSEETLTMVEELFGPYYQ